MNKRIYEGDKVSSVSKIFKTIRFTACLENWELLMSFRSLMISDFLYTESEVGEQMEARLAREGMRARHVTWRSSCSGPKDWISRNTTSMSTNKSLV